MLTKTTTKTKTKSKSTLLCTKTKSTLASLLKLKPRVDNIVLLTLHYQLLLKL